MNTNVNMDTTAPEKLINRPWWFMFRGGVMFVLGSILLLFSLLAPNVEMLGGNNSWLPIASILILIFGVFRGIDAFASNSKSLFIMNMQSSVIDLVCGFVILTNVGETAFTFSLLVSAYLLIQGILRLGTTMALEVINPTSARIGGIISLILGVMIWLDWPISGLWFLSFALSAEVANRGWALMLYAHSVNKQQALTEG
ncbi:MAG: hypothetical protein GQ581_05000 [Methyloprofundus sp.]|nr:hypothetical protein [Methyloprofundus sp.]